MSSGGPSPSCFNPNIGGKGKGKGNGKGKDKNNGSGNNNSNNSKGTPMWPSFYNLETGTISMWPGMCPPQRQPACPP
jgi:hypothetical protein